jgi:hypothetical protein
MTVSETANLPVLDASRFHGTPTERAAFIAELRGCEEILRPAHRGKAQD